MSDQMPVKPDSQVKPSPARSSPVQPGQAKSCQAKCSHQQSPATDSHQSLTVTSPQQSPVTQSHQSPTVTIRQQPVLPQMASPATDGQPSHGKPVQPQTASPTEDSQSSHRQPVQLQNSGPVKSRKLNNTVRQKKWMSHNQGYTHNQDYIQIV